MIGQASEVVGQKFIVPNITRKQGKPERTGRIGRELANQPFDWSNLWDKGSLPVPV